MLIFILSINLIILIVIFIIYFGFSKNILVQETQEKAMEKVNGVVNTLEGYLNDKAKIAWTFSQHPILKKWLKTNDKRRVNRRKDLVYAQIIDYLDGLVKRDGEIMSAFIASEKVQFYWDNTERPFPSDYQVGVRPWYMNIVKKGKPGFDVDIDAVDHTVRVNYRHPIYDQKGELLGIGGIDISLDNFKKLMLILDDVFDTGQAFLVGEDGMILYHPNQEMVLKNKLSDFSNDGKQYRNINQVNQKVINGSSGIEYVVFEGEKRYFMFTPIQDIGWTLVLSVSASEINAPLKILARTSLFIVVLATIFLVLAIVFVTGTISKPINRLVAMLKDIAKGEGNLVKRMRIDSKDELGELARWFNIFVDKMYEIVTQVKRNTEEIASATSDISSTSTQLVSVAEEQTLQASEVAGSVQEVATAIVRNSQNAKETAKIAEQASFKANEGKKAIRSTQEGMGEIVQFVSKAMTMIQQIATVSGEQSAGAEEISKNVNAISMVTKQSASGVEQMAASIERLNQQTDELRNLVNQFKLQEDDPTVITS